MQARDAYPFDALTGGCFVSGDYNPANGIVDLELYMDTLPPFGRLCLSGMAVRNMVTALGWTIQSDELTDQVDELIERNNALAEENARMRKAISQIIDITKIARIDDSWLVAS